MHDAHDWDELRYTLLKAEKLCNTLQTDSDSPLKQALLSVTMSVSPELWLSQDEIEERQFEADVVSLGKIRRVFNSVSTSTPSFTSSQIHLCFLTPNQTAISTELVLAGFISTGKINKAHEMGQAVQQQHLTNGDMIEYSKACNFMGNCLRQMGRLHEVLDTFKVGIQTLENSTQQRRIAYCLLF